MTTLTPSFFGNTSSERQLLTALLWFILLAGGYGYPGGAPDIACESMIPTGHGVEPQTSAPPYNIMVSKKSYKPGETLQVIVQSQGEDFYRGIFLQARMVGCQVNETKIVGVFTVPDTELETKHCFGEVHSAVTHNSARKKRFNTFYWTAPVIPAGHVVMRATFVRQINEYWTNVESHLVADLSSDTLPRCLPTLAPSSTGTTSAPSPSTTLRQSASTKLVVQNPELTPSQQTTSDEQKASTSIFVGSQGDDFKLVTRLMTTIQQVEQKLKGETPEGTETTEEEREEKRNKEKKNYTEGLPSWLGPSFQRNGDHRHTTQADDVGETKKVPSWLIPAYQRSDASSACSLRSLHSGLYILIITVALLVLAWEEIAAQSMASLL